MGFIKIDRGILKWGWYDDPATKSVFLHLLLNANYEDGEYRGEKILAGQVVFGRKKYAEALGLSEQNVRTAIEHLHKTGEISTSKVTNKFTIINIEKWTDYQVKEDKANQQTNQRLTNDQPTTNQRLTTSKKERNKEIKKERIYIGTYGEFDNVKLTDDEYAKLVEKFPRDYQEKVENLSTYLKQTGRRYKSHYATILAWDRKDQKNKPKDKPKGRLDWIDDLIKEERANDV